MPAEAKKVFTKELKSSLGIKGQVESQRPGLACPLGGQHAKSWKELQRLCVCEETWTLLPTLPTFPRFPPLL